MTDRDGWRDLLGRYGPGVADVEVETFHQKFGTNSQPVLATCSDGFQYVLKGPIAHNVQCPFHEQVVARLGQQIAAPIPPVRLAGFSDEARVAEPPSQQFIYKLAAPHLVFSFDHGHFFAGGGTLTPAHLAAQPAVTAWDTNFAPAALTGAELSPVLRMLERISDADIARIVAISPDDWGVDTDVRVAMCEYLDLRRRQIVTIGV